LDRLKAVNDTLGHAAGDLLLRQVAGRLRGRLRRSDSVGRLGGDEFVILLTDVGDPVAIKTLAGKILGCFDEPFDLGVGEVSISASLGICLFPDHGSSPEELLRNADAAMYQAKFEGGNTYRFFSPRMKRNRSLLVPTTGPAAP
jgi:diguanylate cyclase (GGDEF)-like protein